MEKPLALKVISIIIIVFSATRLLGGLLGVLAFLVAPELGINLLYVIIVENFICGVLLLMSGIILLKGTKKGRILLIIATILPPISSFIFLNEFNYYFTISITLIILLYLYPSIKSYFKSIEEVE